MARTILKDEQWDRIKDMLPGKVSDPGSTANNRLFVEAILWMIRTGAPWRDLPDEFGDWGNTYNRFNRWCLKGIWNRVFEELNKYCDWNIFWLMALLPVFINMVPPKKSSSC